VWVVIAIVAIMAIVVATVFFTAKSPGSGLEDDEDDL